MPAKNCEEKLKKNVVKILKELENAEPSYALPKNASVVETLKHKLCCEVVCYLKENDISQAALARKLELDPARLSEIVHYKTTSFTIDRLIQVVLKIRPKLRVTIS